jgi:hypothetical protein
MSITLFFCALRQVVIGFLNWVSPSTVSSNHQEQQANFISQCVNASEKNIGILLSPMHCYKAGQLWLLDHQCQKTLAQRACHVDRGFGLAFKDKADARDRRPLLYRGRFVMAGHMKEHETMWKQSELFSDCITKPASLLPTRDMRTVEDLDPSALPSTYDDSSGKNNVQVATKYMQIGEDAADKIIGGMLQNMEFAERSAVLLLDLSPDVGDFCNAFITNKAKYTFPMFYFAACKDEVRLEWFEKTMQEHLVRLFGEGKLNVPGFTPKPKDPPTSLLETAPPKPTLNLMTWLPDHDGKPNFPRGVAIPPAMVDRWYQHVQFGEEFRKFYDDVVELCGSPDHAV